MKIHRLVTLLLSTSLCLAVSSQDSQHSDAKNITPSNVTKLKLAWVYRTGEPLTPMAGGGKAPAFEATPVYFEGMLYIGTPYGKVIALDPVTGLERWVFDAQINRNGNYGDFTNRGVSVWTDPKVSRGTLCARRIFFASVDAQLVSLDALTGKPCAQFGREGRIDLTSGMRRGPAYAGEVEETSPPAIIDDLVVVGSAIADNVRSNAPSSEVRALDARTGAVRWKWDPLAGSPEVGAGNVWSRITADPENHLVFVPTGSPSPDYFGGLRPGDNLFANSVVALSSSTGKPVWHFQTVHHDLWDYDVASPPALLTVQRGGRRIPAVAVGSKTGHIFLLDRLSGKPLFSVEERAVPTSRMVGESASPTQPFPSLPPSLARQSLSVEEAWGPTESDRDWCRRAIASLRSEGIFTPPSLEGSLSSPGHIGGLHWGGIATDSDRGLMIAPSNNLPAVVRLVPREDLTSYRNDHKDWETSPQAGTPFAMSRTFLRSPSGLPCNPPPFGVLSAVDVQTGKIRWQVPLGTMPGAKPEWGSINLGGPLVTAGGVVFIGASLDPQLKAFDSGTGKELWKGQLPASARSTPMSFRASDGKQYVVIAAGGHDPALGKLDNAVVAFVLP